MITVIKSQGKAYEELQAANELMYNLISNAIKFAHPGRDLRINIKSELYPEICFCMDKKNLKEQVLAWQFASAL
jgi:hypothetical protein